ncbi:hypothetical protein R1sor_021857 [Riccia sorocarpa]|uniref:Uncharacterized protein n=1 Tax=Riccia sorocarpa TaxID=122646 RepID=A0ABD3GJW9_9MARC
MRSTKALQSVVRRLGRFDGREVSHYFREYRGELVLAKVSDTEIVANFELVVEPELRDRVREIARRFIIVLGGWDLFECAMKEEFLEEDTERITRRTFLDWVERRPGLTMGLNELFRKFDRREELWDTMQYRMFSSDMVCRMEHSHCRLLLGSTYGCPSMGVPQAPTGGPNGNQEQQNAIDDLTRQLRDLRVEMAGLRRGQALVAKGRPRVAFPRQCIWCDSPDHLRAECGELAAVVREGIVHYGDGRLHLTASGQPLVTRFGRGGMRTLILAPVGGAAAAVAVGDQHRIADVLAGHLDFAGVACPMTLEDAYRGHITPRSMEELRRGAQAFRKTIGWEDPLDLTSVQAYLNMGKHVHWADDAIVDEKRRRDATDLDPEFTSVSRSSCFSHKKPRFLDEILLFCPCNYFLPLSEWNLCEVLLERP